MNSNHCVTYKCISNNLRMTSIAIHLSPIICVVAARHFIVNCLIISAYYCYWCCLLAFAIWSKLHSKLCCDLLPISWHFLEICNMTWNSTVDKKSSTLHLRYFFCYYASASFEQCRQHSVFQLSMHLCNVHACMIRCWKFVSKMSYKPLVGILPQWQLWWSTRFWGQRSRLHLPG